jgi:hypothetical protein
MAYSREIEVGKTRRRYVEHSSWYYIYLLLTNKTTGVRARILRFTRLTGIFLRACAHYTRHAYNTGTCARGICTLFPRVLSRLLRLPLFYPRISKIMWSRNFHRIRFNRWTFFFRCSYSIFACSFFSLANTSAFRHFRLIIIRASQEFNGISVAAVFFIKSLSNRRLISP